MLVSDTLTSLMPTSILHVIGSCSLASFNLYSGSQLKLSLALACSLPTLYLNEKESAILVLLKLY